jgi:hypothetical protein
MIDLERARVFSLALFEVFLILVSELPGLPMTRVTEVVRTEAEVESDRAAIAAFVINKLLFVLFAVGVAIVCALEHIRGALRADQLLWLVLKLSFLFILRI